MALSLDARLLCAASHAYKVFADGVIRPTDEPAPKTRSVLAGYGDTAVGVVAGPESRDAALVGDTPDGVVLAFRGTVPPILSLSGPADLAQPQRLWGEIERIVLDWSNDAHALAMTHPLGGTIHRGFALSFSLLWPKLKPVLRARLDARPGAPLIITGHSKGGALAVLAAAQCAVERLQRTVKVRTFAAPRTGSSAFAAAYDALGFDTERFEFVGDIVPHLPFTTAVGAVFANIIAIPFVDAFTTLEFDSVGRLRFIGANHKIETTPPPVEALRWGATLLADLPDPVGLVVRAHAIGPASGYADAVGLT
jgi:hypothetical protein